MDMVKMKETVKVGEMDVVMGKQKEIEMGSQPNTMRRQTKAYRLD